MRALTQFCMSDGSYFLPFQHSFFFFPCFVLLLGRKNLISNTELKLSSKTLPLSLIFFFFSEDNNKNAIQILRTNHAFCQKINSIFMLAKRNSDTFCIYLFKKKSHSYICQKPNQTQFSTHQPFSDNLPRCKKSLFLSRKEVRGDV